MSPTHTRYHSTFVLPDITALPPPYIYTRINHSGRREEERDILSMGAVHDDVAVHQFGVLLDHTPEEREKERE